MEDDYLHIGQQTGFDFFQIENSREYDDNWFEGEYNVAIYLRFDNNYDIYERKIYDLMALLGDIGGLAESLNILGAFFVAFFAHRMFIGSILKHIYQLRNSSMPKTEGNTPSQAFSDVEN